jgi:hypothetical protein
MGNPIKWGGAEQGITQRRAGTALDLEPVDHELRSFSEFKCCNELVSASAAPDGISNLSRHENGHGKQKNIASGWMFETAFASVDRGEGLRA